MPESTVYTQRTNLVTILSGLLVSLVGGLFLFISHELAYATHVLWAAVIRELGAILIATGCVAVLWELAAKRTFLEEILAVTQLAQRIERTGISDLAIKWYDDIPWARLLAEASHATMFFSYAISWRGVLGRELTTFSQRKNTTCRIILPDPNSDSVVKAMALQFGKTEEEIKYRINYAVTDFCKELDQPGAHATYEIWFSSKPFLFSYCILDNAAVVTMYKHNPAQLDVIGLVVRKGGAYYSFLENELNVFVEGDKPIAKIARSGPPKASSKP